MSLHLGPVVYVALPEPMVLTETLLSIAPSCQATSDSCVWQVLGKKRAVCCGLKLSLSDTQHAVDKSHRSLEGQWVTFWPAGVTSQAMLMYGIALLASCSATAAASCISSRACHGTSSSLHNALHKCYPYLWLPDAVPGSTNDLIPRLNTTCPM